MTITANDLVLIKSQDMNDYPTSGGLPSRNIIESGKSNEIFDDISDIAATYGAVSLRKIFAGVQTDTAEKLQASRMILTRVPSNSNINIYLFNTGDWADKRKNAESRLTSYYSQSVKMAGHLLEKQLKGQRAIQVSLDERDPLPVVGDKLVLIQNEAQNDEFLQFVSVVKIKTVFVTHQKLLHKINLIPA